MDINLKGKRIVFTGATSGLGKEALNYLIQQEAKIFVLYRNEKLMKALVNCENVVPVHCDLSSIKSLNSAIEIIKKLYRHA